MSSGPDAGTTTDRFNDDLGITVTWNSTSEIQFNRQSGGTNEDVRVYWEVVEGVTSGGNEWVIRYDGEVSMGTTTTQQDTAVASIGTLGNCVPIITGIRNDRTIDNAKNYQVHGQMVNVSGDKVRLTRHDHNSTTNIVSVVVIEYTGANYTVDNNISHTFVASTTDETETTTDVIAWTTAWIESGYIADTATVLDSSCVVRPGATTTTVRFWKRGVAGTEIAIAHVVKCSDAGFLSTHYDSITGGETDHPAGSASPQTVSTTIAAVVATERTSLVATAVTEGGAADAPRAHWSFTLASTTQVDWWRGRHGAASEWALQVIEWPAAVPVETFDVQTGVLEYGATEDTDTATVTEVASIGAGGQAFARPTNTMFASAGPAAGTTTTRNGDDMNSKCYLTATTTVTMARASTGENVDYHHRFEVLELPSTGDHAGIVRLDTEVTMAAATAQVDTAVASVTDINDCVAFVCGVESATTSGESPDRWSVTAKVGDFGGGNVARLDRGDSADEQKVRVVVIELTGAAWTVEQIDVSHTATGAQSTTIADVTDWTTAFIVGSHRTDNHSQDRATFCIYPGASTTSVSTYIADAASTNDFTLYIVKNSSLTVEHLNSISGGEADHPDAGGQPQTVNTTITAVSDLAQVSVFATVSRPAGSGSELSASCWCYQLTSTTNLQWERSNDQGACEWAAQIVTWPTATVANVPGVMVMSA